MPSTNSFDYLNETLFEGELPACMLTFANKGKKTEGYCSEESEVVRDAA